MKTIWQRLVALWQAWKRLARKIGNFQARVLLTIIYGALLLPIGLIVRIFADLLHIKKPPEHWANHPEEVQDFEWARRQ